MPAKCEIHNPPPGRCKVCHKLKSRESRAEGKNQAKPGVRARRYWKNRGLELSKGRARYHANKAKYCAMRRVNRLRKRDLSAGELDHIQDLLVVVRATQTVRIARGI